MRRFELYPLTCWGALALFGSAAEAAAGDESPEIVDRVVAVVGEQPILLSEVHDAARVGATGAAIGANELQEAAEVLIDAALIRNEAEGQHITITDAEVDRAVATVAESNGLTVEQLYTEARKSDLDPTAYRSALRDQLREQKLLHLDVAPEIEVEDSEVDAAYEEMVVEARRHHPYRAAWIVLRVAKDASVEQVEATRTRSDEIVRQARAGKPFADLARQHSHDPATRAKGGDLGRRMVRGQGSGMTLRADLERQALRLAVGETSPPIRVDEGFVVIQITERTSVSTPPLEEVRDALYQSVYSDKLARARRAWLDDLRSKTFVELRFDPARSADGATR